MNSLNTQQNDIVRVKRGHRDVVARVTHLADGKMSILTERLKEHNDVPVTDVLAILHTGEQAAQYPGCVKPTREVPKTDRAVEIYKEFNAKGRKAVMEQLCAQLGMQMSTANTYYYLAKKRAIGDIQENVNTADASADSQLPDLSAEGDVVDPIAEEVAEPIIAQEDTDAEPVIAQEESESVAA